MITREEFRQMKADGNISNYRCGNCTNVDEADIHVQRDYINGYSISSGGNRTFTVENIEEIMEPYNSIIGSEPTAESTRQSISEPSTTVNFDESSQLDESPALESGVMLTMII